MRAGRWTPDQVRGDGASPLLPPSIGPRDGELDGLGQRRLGLPGGERPQRVDGALAVGAGAGEGVVEGAAVSEQAGGVREIVVGGAAGLDRPAPEMALLLGAAGVGEDDGQSNLAVAEIVAGILAHDAAVGGIVDRIVDELEGDAEVAAVAVERVLDLLVALADDG